MSRHLGRRHFGIFEIIGKARLVKGGLAEEKEENCQRGGQGRGPREAWRPGTRGQCSGFSLCGRGPYKVSSRK